MKKLFYLLIVLVFPACSDSFLELYPETSLNEGNFYQSESEFILLVNGCYVPMRNYEKNLHWVLAELQSDNTSFQYNNKAGSASTGRDAIDQFLPASNYTTYADFWRLSYSGITRCNKLLHELDRPGVNWSKASYKERCAGEALFLRALYYFNLVRQFGGVPLVLEPITSQEAVKIKRSAEEQIYEQIVNDLKAATDHLSKAKDVKEDGRASLGAARALLGKVYLTLHRYDEAEAVLGSVIESNEYALLADYADLFDPANKDFKETIFAIQYSENNDELSNHFIFLFAPHTSAGAVTQRPNINIANSAGWNQPTQDLIDAFEPGDERKAVSVKYWTGPDWDNEVRDIPYCGKYKPPVSSPDNRCSDNLPVLRYSDVLLMYAEALNELGRTADALPYVQEVRSRAGLTAPLAGYDQETLAALIAKERRVEFCFENQRWYDLKRTGKAVEVMTAHGIREKERKAFLYASAFEIAPFKLLAPIPEQEVLVNKLEQNPGY